MNTDISSSAWEISAGDVRERVLEYMGGSSPGTVTCTSIAVCDVDDPSHMDYHRPDELDELLEAGTPLSRSLDDTESILVHLDLEYVNFDEPAAAFTDPWHAFEIQEPVVDAVEELLSTWGIRPLHLITGQGHHFVWRVNHRSAVAREVAELAFPNQVGTAEDHRRSFAGLALAMEYFAQEIRRRAIPGCAIPVELTAVHVGPGSSGRREMVSIDISEYGDPIESRSIRIPFTTYRKPWKTGLIEELGLDDEIGRFVTLPLHEMDVMQCLKCRQDAGDIVDLAKRTCVRIPLQEEGTSRLLRDYGRSRLREFHATFYSENHDPPESWPDTYDRMPMDDDPACLKHILNDPNDLLLKPSGMQLVTRCLMARDWHPRHIAGLIRSRFENPAYRWERHWEGYDPGMRADFYVRLFGGLIASGTDPLIDFNCTSQQEKGYCWPGNPPCSLKPYHDRLISQPEMKE